MIRGSVRLCVSVAEGTERVALAAMVTYLEMNGFTWKCSEVILAARFGDARRQRNPTV